MSGSNAAEQVGRLALQVDIMATVLNRAIMAIVSTHPDGAKIAGVIFQTPEKFLADAAADPQMPDAARAIREILDKLSAGVPH